MKTLKEILDSYSNLGDFGFVVRSRGMTDAQYAQKLHEERSRLMRSTAEIDEACKWIQANLEPSAKINRGANSYGIKHYAEKEAGYTSNGCFIAAALMCGYECQQCAPDSPNAYFNVTTQKIKQLKKLYYAR
jgi:hypothetical protein